MKLNDKTETDPRLFAIPDIHGHAKGEHKPYTEERPIPLSARMLFLWFFHACRRGWPRFLMVSDHMNYLTFEDPAAVNLVRRALKLAQAGDLYGAAETASVEVGHAAVVSEGLRRGMRYSIGAEVDNDPRSRPDAQNIVDAMKPDGMIRSVHFIPVTHPVHGENWNWPFDNPEFADVFAIVGTEKTWEIYVDTLIDAVERLPGQIVGHFYVPGVFGHWPDDATLERYEDRLLEACEARGMAIEFNTRFLYRETDPENRARFIAAYTRLLTKAKAKNVGIAVGSDAHSPRDQGGGFATVLAILDACEINEIVFPIAGRLARVALRAERAPEPEPPEVPDTAPAAEKKPARKARRGEAPEPAADAAAASPVAAPEPAPEPVSAAPRAAKKKTSKAASAPPPPAVDDGPGAVAVAPAAEPVAPEAEPEPEPEPVPEPLPEPVVAVAPEPEAAAEAEPEPEPVHAAPAPVRAAKPARAPVKAPPAKAPPAKAKAKAPAPKRAPAKKAAPAAKPPAKKVAAKAPKAAAAKRPVAKKSAPAKKVAAKKAPAKKAVAKRAPARPAPKKAAVRRPAVKKASPKKTAAKKPAAKKSAKRR